MIDQIYEAVNRISPVIRKTPCHFSQAFSDKFKADVWFKYENLQVTGSFKVRGAINKIFSLVEQGDNKGVVSASTGNHGAAVAFAAKKAGMSCTIFVPESSSPAKIKNMKQFGAQIQITGSDCIESETRARAEAEKSGLTYVSPYNDLDVMAGQGTLGVEISNQCPDMDVAIISVGGGGLIGGTGTALKQGIPTSKVWGSSPVNSAVMLKSLEAGHVLELESLPTLSDGTAGGVELDSVTFPVCQSVIDESILVSEHEIQHAMISFIDKEHQLIEGAAGTAVAALIQQKEKIRGKRVCVVLCGANISLDTLRTLLN